MPENPTPRRSTFKIPANSGTKPERGKSWFFGIGINQYTAFSPLNNAVKDVRDLIGLLREQYDLDPEYILTLFDKEATRENIIRYLDRLQKKVGAHDKLLIYYSGHGHLNKETNKGYWIPTDAERDNTAAYIRNSTIREYLETLPALHTLLISDSCFSGSLFVRGASRSTIAINELATIPSRWAICSGRHDEEVYDGKPGGNSPFAESIMDTLRHNQQNEYNVAKLIDRVVDQTRSNYRQLPEGNPLFGVGHKGGQYIFQRRTKEGSGADSRGYTQQKPVSEKQATRTVKPNEKRAERVGFMGSHSAQNEDSSPGKNIRKWLLIAVIGVLLILVAGWGISKCSGPSPTSMSLCDNEGGDKDGDEVCADYDCDDNDANIKTMRQTPGTGCDDGNPNTENDQIQSDSCTCAGIEMIAPSPCADVDGDEICADKDCDDNDASIKTIRQTPGTVCDDLNSETKNDVIQPDGCTCLGSEIPCLNEGGDQDEDGVCAYYDCDDNNANIKTLRQTPGATCDDGNPKTENDRIQGDECTCQGTPIPCVDEGGDRDKDGVCASRDCNDRNASIGARRPVGTPCDDGNPNTKDDRIQSDQCTCKGTLIPCLNEGGDQDNDGFCADYDCDDRNANIGASRSLKFTVYANNITSGEVTLKKGWEVKATASGSGIKFGFDTGAGFTPAGENTPAPGTFAAPDKRQFVLLAKVGSDFYEISTANTFIVERDGALNFLFNDEKGEFGNNTGSATVDITITCHN